MSITDELREWASSELSYKTRFDELIAIADRIDAEHEEAIQQALIGEGGVPATDENMAECGWIRLPVDADGVPIRVGDVVDVMPTDKFTGHRNVVVTSVIFRHSAALVTVDTADRPFTFMPNRIRHHHAPTAEDVLREFAEKMNENMGMYVGEAIDADEWRDADRKTIAEYAAKLRLADDGEEQ